MVLLVLASDHLRIVARYARTVASATLMCSWLP